MKQSLLNFLFCLGILLITVSAVAGSSYNISSELPPPLSERRDDAILVSGTVTSAAEEPLPGVNVIIKGTSTGTITDFEGNYSLEVPDGSATLIFSFIGYAKKEVANNDQSVLNVVLIDDTQQLEEGVVTAIGIERDKKALGYSTTTVDKDQLTQKAESDPVRAMTGKVPGVNIQGGEGGVGSATNITIRGNSSLTQNTQPLFVVDGVPFDNSSFGNGTSDGSSGNQFTNRAFDLDPNNIESMTVLKGASAAALYGSRAANGVIVITTKAGARGVKKGLEV